MKREPQSNHDGTLTPLRASGARGFSVGREAAWIAGTYVIFSALWILFSDKLLAWLVSDETLRTQISIVKGLGFVLVTGWLLYQMVRRTLKAWVTENGARRTLENERLDAAKRLLASEERLRMVLQATADGVWDWDIKNDVTYLSDRYWELCGYSRGEVETKYEFFRKLVHPAHWEAVTSSIHDHFSGLTTQSSVRYRMVCKDGSEKWIWGRGQVVERSPDGAPLRMVGLVSDITRDKRSEQVLEESEHRYRQLFELESDAILVGDADTHQIVDVNQSAVRLYGYSKDEFLRMKLEDVSAEVEVTKRSIDDDEASVPCRWHKKKSGERFLVEISVNIIEHQGRRLKQGAIRDITERKRAELSLMESEKQFRSMFELSSIGMAQANPHTRELLRVNSMLCQITGYSADELLKMRVTDLTHRDDRAGDNEAFQQLLNGAVTVGRGEKRFVHRDGSVVWVNVNLTLLRDEEGTPLRTLATIEDVTERRRSQETYAQLATVIEQAVEGILISDTKGVIMYVNPSFEKLTGYGRDDVIGRRTNLLKSGKHEPAFYQQLWATLTRGEKWSGRFVNRKKDGTVYEEDSSIFPVRDAAGTIVNYATVKRDVTREIQLEAQLRQSQKMDAIGQLAGGVAHDFNNILASILMQTELIGMEGKIDDGAAEGLRQIAADSRRAAELTRQLLLFSRRQVMQSKLLNLNDVVVNLAKMLQRIIGEDVRLNLNLSPALLLTKADAGMLEQVLLNLAVNSRDAMPEGGTLSLETYKESIGPEIIGRCAEASPGDYVGVRVADTGTGIPPEIVPHIFEPFFTTKEAGKGTGLGLATVFGIVKQHNGWVELENRIGKGVTFSVFLPASSSLRPEEVEAFAKPKPRGGTETLLLVEDEPSVRKLTRAALERHGYQVLEASDGREALRVWTMEKEAIALLLTDLVMPGGLSGKELGLRLSKEKASLKILYFSGYSAETAGRELMLNAGENFVEKPFSTNVLLEAVRTCLDSVR